MLPYGHGEDNGAKSIWCMDFDRSRAALIFKTLAINIKKYIASE